jgi:CRP-like cAMP-binding protein/Fe-S-cluster-containing hydrogenase component 2
VHLPVVAGKGIVDFLAACTQCRQCVPACPADLSRADMVLFNKMKVEDTVPDHMLPLQFGGTVTQSAWMLDGLAGQLTHLPIFAGTAVGDLRRLLLTVTLRQLVPGEELCREGEFHERLYVVMSGSVEQSSMGPRGKVRLLVLGPGSFFGEMAVVADQPEPFTVTALEMTVVLEIPKAAVHRLMQHSPSFRDTMDELYRRRALFTYARQPGGLGGLPDDVVDFLFAAAELRTLKSGEYVFREGDPPGDVFLVRTGFLRVTRRVGGVERVVVYFREGDLFGLLPLLFGERAQCFGVQATSRADVIRIPAAYLSQVFARYPHLRDQLGANAFEMERVARSAELAPSGGTGDPFAASNVATSLHALVDAGVLKGRAVLVVDQTRCTYCQNCVDACERRHGASRLVLRGLQMGDLLFPTACRHCEDPVCLLCSVNGIVRIPSGEITIVEDNCIGCGACAERCPYGNISMHPVDPPRHGFVFRLIDLLTGGALRARALAELDPRAPRKAVKCDLCAGHDDYACVTACPTGAAFRVDDPAMAFGQANMVIGLDPRNRAG